jgi:hypothetical protein
MPVRLNITIDEDVYEHLKRELPAEGISRFINEAIRARRRLSCASRKPYPWKTPLKSATFSSTEFSGATMNTTPMNSRNSPDRGVIALVRPPIVYLVAITAGLCARGLSADALAAPVPCRSSGLFSSCSP